MNEKVKPSTVSTADLHRGVEEILAEADISNDAAQDLMRFDLALFRFHRLAMKGELPAIVIRKLGLQIETAQFQCLATIAKIIFGVGTETPRVATVGLVAEEMSIDPSRASRIIADLVGRGYVVRVAAQDDGRKSIIELSERGKSLLDQFREERWRRLRDIFKSWPEEDIKAFSRLFGRYVEESEKIVSEMKDKTGS